jgi:hypothetical protein
MKRVGLWGAFGPCRPLQNTTTHAALQSQNSQMLSGPGPVGGRHLTSLHLIFSTSTLRDGYTTLKYKVCPNSPYML